MELFNQKDQESWNHIFGHIAPEMERSWKSTPPMAPMEDCLQFFRTRGVASVLDIGCGVGVWSVFLARNGLRVLGSDFSLHAIEFARAWAREAALEVSFSVATITESPFDPLTFDAVVASQILDNVSRTEMKGAIEVLHRRLRPGGVVYALFNPYLNEEQIAAYKRSDNPTKDITLTIYSDDELKAAFAQFDLVGFKTYPQGSRGLYLST